MKLKISARNVLLGSREGDPGGDKASDVMIAKE